jgi:hypothetical protein
MKIKILIHSPDRITSEGGVLEPPAERQNKHAYNWGGGSQGSQGPRTKTMRDYFIPVLGIVYRSHRSRWDKLKSLQFVGDGASQSPNPDLLAHAKIYVFATRYLVDPLRKQFLKSLHRDLCGFSLDSHDVSQIFDLLAYTYEVTGRQEPSGSYSLGNLVVDYVSCNMQALTKNPCFRRILDEHEEIGSDLVAKLVEGEDRQKRPRANGKLSPCIYVQRTRTSSSSYEA